MAMDVRGKVALVVGVVVVGVVALVLRPDQPPVQIAPAEERLTPLAGAVLNKPGTEEASRATVQRSVDVLTRMDAAVAEAEAAMAEQAMSETVRSAWITVDVLPEPPSVPLNPMVQEAAMVQVPPAYELDYGPGDKVRLTLPDGSELPVTVATSRRLRSGDLTWKGFVDGYGEDFPVIFTAGTEAAFATLTSPEGSFTMESVGGTGWVYRNVHDDGEDVIDSRGDHAGHQH